MGQRQLELWHDRVDQDRRLGESAASNLSFETRTTIEALVQDQVAYVSLKRVSLTREGSIRTRPALTSAADSKEFFARYWNENPGNDQERFVVACLDTKHHVQCVVVVTVGTLDASLIHPREVFKPAIIEGSSAIILSHNHPSGDTTPSREDRAVTKRLTEAGELLGITVLDHLIHGDGTNEVLSIRES